MDTEARKKYRRKNLASPVASPLPEEVYLKSA